ncbi:methyl-accepting chemotaxis protein [Planomonospora venezuelensis]|uniref:Methyl-accepting chemotaxis protein n=1 Tax=Planomonospora venezuelensis TaxID=1999 RepID=A0A841DDT1_PLAVE|nr:methyl-accepting chemotaxis protein [Planomonospora venezuelensis]MBB5966458.1 methyl-accepting chemotaxis protein [Planomonospora venezuelensis]GIN04114.1 methyl-accepting chemotaxis protein [Planomonospora venezuelensis]
MKAATMRTDAGRRRRWADMPIGMKIAFAMLITLLVSSAATLATLVQASTVRSAGQSIYTGNVQPMVVISDLRDAVRVLRLDQNEVPLRKAGTEAMQETLDEVDGDIHNITELLEEYRPVAAAPDKVEEFVDSFDAYSVIAEQQMLPAALKGDVAAYVSIKDTGQADELWEACKALLKEMVEAEKSEAAATAADLDAEYDRAVVLSVAFLSGAVLLGLALAVWVSRGISRPLRGVADALSAVADGDLAVEVPDPGTRDEVGVMAGALRRSLEAMRASVQQVLTQARQLSAASGELTGLAARIESGATVTAAQSHSAAAAADQVSASVTTVAGASEEMNAAIADISRSAASAVQVAQQAMNVAAQTNASVATLGAASAEVGDVVKVISSIAEQTNLLALNATIEAARAGEAGKGFAVVATEVKDLAQETAKATEEISRKIAAIQASSTEAARALSEITGIVEQINEHQTTVASAVEEQTATTQEISRSVGQAATGMDQIARSVTDVSHAAEESNAGAVQAAGAAQQLADLARDLDRSIAHFRV